MYRPEWSGKVMINYQPKSQNTKTKKQTNRNLQIPKTQTSDYVSLDI